jgi:hypothetical protein
MVIPSRQVLVGVPRDLADDGLGAVVHRAFRPLGCWRGGSKEEEENSAHFLDLPAPPFLRLIAFFWVRGLSVKRR